MNEFAPLLSDATFAVAENAANGTEVGTLTATDADATNGGFSYSILAGNDLGIFAIDAATGVITVADNANLDRESISQVVLTVEVSDNGPGVPKTDTAAVTINVSDVNEFAPVVSEASFFVANNAANGTEVGTATATDADATDGGLSFAIMAGNELGIFAIDTATGVITVADNANLSQEGLTQVVLTVEASDNGPGAALSGTAAVTIGVV